MQGISPDHMLNARIRIMLGILSSQVKHARVKLSTTGGDGVINRLRVFGSDIDKKTRGSVAPR